MSHPKRLQGRTCLIVGGTGGIGLATAERFLEEGAAVVVAGKPDEDLGQIRERLASKGPVWIEPVDVSDALSVEQIFQQTEIHLGKRLDVLFHVAGISGRRFGDGPLHDCTEEGWEKVLNVNARGMFLTNQAAVTRMRMQEMDNFGLRGTVVNLGSVLAQFPSPALFGTIAYAASKGAAMALTLSAAAMYAPERVRFQLLAPGLIDTPMAARACRDRRILGYLASKQAIAGGPGSPADVAEAALFLCEPASRFSTGLVLNVDGGWSLLEGQQHDDD
jgi:NAD(P)-dependent dehydrogenase (short-subunit alcohol dehydrogenase family)